MARVNSKDTNIQMLKLLLLLPIVRGDEFCQCDKVTEMINCSSKGLTTLYEESFSQECNDSRNIDLSHNNFDKVPFYLLAEMEFINVSYNSLKKIEAEVALSKLQTLDVSSNNIEHIKLGDYFRYLQILYAVNNNLRGADYLNEVCDSLKELDLSGNLVTSLQPVTIYSNLSHLNASRNRIQVIPDSFQELTELKILDLSSNVLQSVSFLPKSLETLNLASNKLAGVQISSFAGLQALKVLDLSRNSISALDEEAFAGLIVLEHVDLSGNALGAVPLLRLSDTVQVVALQGNGISTVDLHAAMTLLETAAESRLVDLLLNPINAYDPGLRDLVLRLDEDGGTVDLLPDCTCGNATFHEAIVTFCVVNQPSENSSVCWMDVARQTTTTTTTTAASTTLSEKSVLDADSSAALMANETRDNVRVDEMNIAYITQASIFLSSLGAAKLSFVAFLLVTLVVLIVINWIVGGPVVDDRWWEEKLRADRVVS